MDDSFLNKNNYSGNGWSQYQKLVLQQLEEHGLLLKSINQRINDIEKTNAVEVALKKMEYLQIQKKQKEIDDFMGFVLDNPEGISKRLEKIEKEKDKKNAVDRKMKSFWLAMGGVLVFLIDWIWRIFEKFFFNDRIF